MIKFISEIIKERKKSREKEVTLRRKEYEFKNKRTVMVEYNTEQCLTRVAEEVIIKDRGNGYYDIIFKNTSKIYKKNIKGYESIHGIEKIGSLALINGDRSDLIRMDENNFPLRIEGFIDNKWRLSNPVISNTNVGVYTFYPSYRTKPNPVAFHKINFKGDVNKEKDILLLKQYINEKKYKRDNALENLKRAKTELNDAKSNLNNELYRVHYCEDLDGLTF